jgi:hypothetical protein
MATAERSARGQVSAGPSGVVDQSNVRARAPVWLLPVAAVSQSSVMAAS